MIIVTQRDRIKGHIKEIGTFTETEFARVYGDELDHFATNHNEYFKSYVDDWYLGSTECKFVAYNENDTILSVAYLTGIVRPYKKERRAFFRYGWKARFDRGARKDVYGRLRHIKTYQERKWAHAWDDEEFPPKTRSRRQGDRLPDARDDYWSHNQRSWKKQSKRKHQWKKIVDLSMLPQDNS